MIKPMISRLVATYFQDADSCDPETDQYLTLTMETAGDKPFLAISTERWSIDQPKELHRLLKAFVAAGEPLFKEPICHQE